jgi:hypothetical protein
LRIALTEAEKIVAHQDKPTYHSSSNFARLKMENLSMRFYHFTKNCPLVMSDRLVWSYLIYRSRVDAGASQQRLADALRLSATLTVKPSLTRLVGYQLVEKQEEGWFARPPAGETLDWIAPRSGSHSKWQDRLASVPFKLANRKCPWRTIDLLLWAVVDNHKKEILSYNRLGALVPMPDRSLRACISRWQREGYLKVTYRRGKAFRVAVLKDLPDEWFTPESSTAPTATAATSEISPEPPPAPQADIPPYIREGYLKDMLDQKMSQKLVRELLALMLALHNSERVLKSFGHARMLLNDLIAAARREHAKNPDRNKPPHPGYLLRFKLLEMVKQYCPPVITQNPVPVGQPKPAGVSADLPEPCRSDAPATAAPIPDAGESFAPPPTLGSGLSKYTDAAFESEFDKLPFHQSRDFLMR